ncbi:MAG: hypothetical protein Q8N96_11605 [Methylovulum sp.]|nr:hypothetical protein [Methylovulum sp.]
MTCPANTHRLSLLKNLLFSALAAGLCVEAQAELIEKSPIDKAPVTQIVFTLTPEQMGPFAHSVDIHELVGRVSNNLAQWHYPIKANATGDISHHLFATVGAVQTDATPVGFSFSSGNSDPRAVGFQKAQVIPMTCQINSIKNPDQQAVFKTTVSANGFLPNNQPTSATLEKLSDEISTVCFNLLDELALQPPPSLTGTSVSKPGWMPNVSIEVKNVPAAKPVTNSTPTASETKSGIPNTDQPAIRLENDTIRKQIIIHNQGTPLIFEMGHQRR